MSAWQLLPAVRDLSSRLPETYHHESWELEDDEEIAAAVEVARQDWAQWSAA
jgi:hypothetical protein